MVEADHCQGFGLSGCLAGELRHKAFSSTQVVPRVPCLLTPMSFKYIGREERRWFYAICCPDVSSWSHLLPSRRQQISRSRWSQQLCTTPPWDLSWSPRTGFRNHPWNLKRKGFCDILIDSSIWPTLHFPCSFVFHMCQWDWTAGNWSSPRWEEPQPQVCPGDLHSPWLAPRIFFLVPFTVKRK